MAEAYIVATARTAGGRKGGRLVAPTTQRSRASRDADDSPENVFPNQFGAPA